jgi:outer membrane protein OmpA-like peptidoglycan-associated protein
LRIFASLMTAGILLLSVTACSSNESGADEGDGNTGYKPPDPYVPPDPYKPPDPYVPPAPYEPPDIYVPPDPYVPPKYAPPDFKYTPPEMVHPDMDIKSTDKNVVIEIPESILFDTDSAVLREEAYPALSQIAKSMAKTENATFQIQGHTDNRGTHEHNMQLSNKRVDAVKNALISVDAALLKTEGFGETKPLVSNDSTEHIQKNRRVEIVVVPTS